MAEVSKSSPAVFREERKEDSLVDDRLKLFMISLPSSVCVILKSLQRGSVLFNLKSIELDPTKTVC